jgi:hypothetical protein
MNKKIRLTRKQEVIAIIAIVVLLVGYGVYQVAYGTNESSYKWGHSKAMAEHNCIIRDHPCYDDVGMNDVCGLSSVTNETACDDGWAQAWANIGHETRTQALCDADIKYCPGGQSPLGIPVTSYAK